MDELERHLRAQQLRQPDQDLDARILEDEDLIDIERRLRSLPLLPAPEDMQIPLTRGPGRNLPLLFGIAAAALLLIGIWLLGMLRTTPPEQQDLVGTHRTAPDPLPLLPAVDRQQQVPAIEGLVVSPVLAGPDAAYRLCHRIELQTLTVRDDTTGQWQLVQIPIQRTALLRLPSY